MQIKSFAFILILTSGLCAAALHFSLAQTTAPAKQSALPDAFSIYGDSLEAVRKGQLAYAASPLTEPQLKLRDGTPNEYSVTVPLIINKDKTDLSVWTQINNKPVLLSLDTGGGAGVLLDKATVKKIALDHPHLATISGMSGSEPATEGIAHEMRLGELTLRAIDVAVPSVFRDPDASCILGMSVLSRYRVTLDFTADTMTLSRGGAPATVENNEASITLPFRNDEGKIYLPCNLAGRITWAQVDSGSPINFLSISAAKTLAAQLPAGEFKTVTTHLHAGLGNTYSTTTFTALKRLVPISLDSDGTPPFGTTSQIGMSSADEDYVSSSGVQREAILGVPFLLQFHRVIIDYPNHMLILQGLKHGLPSNLDAKHPGLGKPWPGYVWQATGDGFLEVPEPPAGAAIPVAAAQTTTATVTVNGVTQTITGNTDGKTVTRTADGRTLTTATAAGRTTITMSGLPNDVTNSQMVIINGVKYECPLGSVLTVGADGKAVIRPLSGAVASTTALASAGQNSIRGTGNTVNGSNNSVSGDGNTVFGSNNALAGFRNTLTGSNSNVNGSENQVSGSNNTLAGDTNQVTGSNDTLNSSGQTVLGSNQTTVKIHTPMVALVALPRKENVNTVNGVRYESAVGSVLTVDADGAAHVIFSPQ